MKNTILLLVILALLGSVTGCQLSPQTRSKLHEVLDDTYMAVASISSETADERIPLAEATIAAMLPHTAAFIQADLDFRAAWQDYKANKGTLDTALAALSKLRTLAIPATQ